MMTMIRYARPLLLLSSVMVLVVMMSYRVSAQVCYNGGTLRQGLCTNNTCNVSLCTSQPCQNGGNCTDNSFGGSRWYNCSCPFGFSGSVCQTQTNYCLPTNPCQNNGTCISVFGGFVCNCAGPYGGTTCTGPPPPLCSVNLTRNINFTFPNSQNNIGNNHPYIEFDDSFSFGVWVLVPSSSRSMIHVVATMFMVAAPDPSTTLQLLDVNGWPNISSPFLSMGGGIPFTDNGVWHSYAFVFDSIAGIAYLYKNAFLIQQQPWIGFGDNRRDTRAITFGDPSHSIQLGPIIIYANALPDPAFLYNTYTSSAAIFGTGRFVDIRFNVIRSNNLTVPVYNIEINDTPPDDSYFNSMPRQLGCGSYCNSTSSTSTCPLITAPVCLYSPGNSSLTSNSGPVLCDCIRNTTNDDQSCVCPNAGYAVVDGTYCQSCKAGYFSASSTTTPCALCQVGSASPAIGATSCPSCVPGRFSNAPGALSCTMCSPGSYNNVTGDSSCIACTGNTVQPFFGGITCFPCPDGTAGVGCVSQVDECASMPCQNGGQCIDLFAAFICNCTGTGFNGTLCDNELPIPSSSSSSSSTGSAASSSTGPSTPHGHVSPSAFSAPVTFGIAFAGAIAGAAAGVGIYAGVAAAIAAASAA